jgi:N-acetylglutamate synthase-like GNAT family acetyltransferase
MDSEYITRLSYDIIVASASVLPTADPEVFTLTNLLVYRKERRKGHGKELMYRIIDDADAEHVFLLLFAKSAGRMTDTQLVKWYKQFDFVSATGNKRIMYRAPKAKKITTPQLIELLAL